MSIITTPGHSGANSFSSLTTATAYFATRINSDAWTDAGAIIQAAALIESTRHVNRLLAKYISSRLLQNQALVWPWKGVQVEISADSGSTTSIVDSTFATEIYPDDYFNNGAAFVYDASGAAPEFELRDISDFTRLTGTFTTAPFSAAIDNGDQVWIIPPIPNWLVEATCEHAIFLIEDSQTEGGNDNQAGIVSKGTKDGGSISYRPNPDGDWLCRAAYTTIMNNLPKQSNEVKRA